MSNTIAGKLIGLEVDGNFIDCETACSFSFDTEMLPANTKEKGGNRSFIPGYTGWEMTVDGKLLLVTSNADFKTLLTSALNKDRIRVKISTKENDAFYIHGYGYIDSGNLTANVDSKTSWSIKITGDEAFEYVFNENPVVPSEYPIIPHTESPPVLSLSGNVGAIGKGSYSRPLKIVGLGDSNLEGLNFPVPLPTEQALYTKLNDRASTDATNFGENYPFSQDPIDINVNGRNLAKFNYYSTNWMPDGNFGADLDRNITKALFYNPDIIFCVFTSNEPNFLVPAELAVSRFKAIFELAKANGVRLVFTGTYPRDPYNSAQKQELRNINSQLITAVGADNVLNVLDILGDTNTNIKPIYNHDTVHTNGAGNEVVSNMFYDWVNSRVGIKNIQSFEIQRSVNGTSAWNQFVVLPKEQLTSVLESGYFYRVRRLYKDGTRSAWSNIVQFASSSNPIANVGTTPVSLLLTPPRIDVVLDGSASTPGAGETITEYLWEKISGPIDYTFLDENDNPVAESSIVGQIVKVRIFASATFGFRLTVTNSSSNTNSAVKTVIIEEPVNNVLERFDFGDTGAPSTAGWTPLRGNPASSIISATGLGGSGIICQNNELFTGSGGVGAFNNGYQSSLIYKDENNVTQTVPESVMLGIWGDFSNSGKGLILKNVPAGNYKIWLFASLRAGIPNLGPTNNIRTAWEVIGTTTFLSDGSYNYYLNADDTVQGITVNVQPDANGDIRIKLFYGQGNNAVGIINSLIIKSV